MSEVLSGQTLYMKNVITYRFKAPQETVIQEFMKLGKFLKEQKAAKDGHTVSATHAIEQKAGTQIVDMEIILPLNKKVKSAGDFVFLPEFKVDNALKVTHEGNPNNMMESVNKLIAFINENELVPTTPMYNVAVKEAMTPADADSMILDIYIGVAAKQQ